ncbi:MAG: DUF3794 domain-containing protein [Lachnospiraceae bacterium]|nr:DUF3794 domain-containing protein [Lachnospiraceae bacterium]
MELKKKYIHMSHEKGRAMSQITLDDDYNVPESKSDIMRIITVKGEIHLEETKAESDRVQLKGNLGFQVLYRSDREGNGMSYLEGSIPFSETLNLDGAEEFDPVKVKWEIEDLNIGIINSRKLSIRSLVVFTATIDEIKDEEISCAMEQEEDYEVRKENVDALQLVAAKKDTCRLKNEVILPSNKPNIQELLWKNVQLRGLDTRIMEDTIQFTGELLLYILYKGNEEEERLQWFETTVPLQGEVDCSGCRENLVSYVGVDDVSFEVEVRPDYDGEERMLTVDAVAELDIKLWEEESFEMLCDVYSLKEEIEPAFENIVFERLLMKNNAKCRASERLQLEENQENILQVCCAEGSVQIDTHEISGNGVYVEGTVAVELLYITTDDEMPIGSLKGFLPFHQTIEVPGMEEDGRYELESGLDQLTTILIDNTQVEIKAVINLNLIAFSTKKRKKLQEVIEKETDYENLQKIPGLVGYIVKEGDEIWNIAKENHTTVQEIMATNELTSDQVKKGDKLLIVKSMGA